MRKMLLLGITMSLLISSAAYAYPSLLGPTGGANLPTAAIAAPSTLSLAVDYFDQSSADIDAAVPIRLVYGVSPNLELGASYTIQDGEIAGQPVDLDNWGINGKYVAPVIKGKSAWAIGAVHSEFTDNGDSDFTQLYWVGSRILSAGSRTSPTLRGSLGINWTSVDDFGAADEDSIRPYVSLDLLFPSKVSINLEYQFKDDDIEPDPLTSIVARYPFNENLSGQIGFSNGVRGVLGSDDHDFLIGINYTFRGGRR